MTAPLAGLEALADLRAAGRPPAEAVALLTRAGGPVGAWANSLARSVDQGVELSMALARTGSLTPDEIQAAGGPSEITSPMALRAVVLQRRASGLRRRQMLSALVLPGLMVLMTAVPARLMANMLGSGQGFGWLTDLAPFATLLGLVWLTGTPVGGALAPRLRGLPIVGSIVARTATARVAQLLAAGLAPNSVGPAFAAAARRCDGTLSAGLAATARRMAEGAPLTEALPPAERVGADFALAIAVGAGTDALAERVSAFAVAQSQAAERAAVRAVRFAAWLMVLWATWRAMLAFGEVDLGQFGGGLPGLQNPELDQLMQEIDLDGL